MAVKTIESAKGVGMKYFKMLMVACFITMAVVACRPDVSMAVVRQKIAAPVAANKDRIQPCHKNPRYWKYKGKPVLLLGGTDDDNLFQWTGSRLTEQLDLLKSVGGNYVRCTMSGRDEGNVWPFRQVNGKYNLGQWDNEYWRRFENFLKLTHERDIIVQVEIWATYDFYGKHWLRNPFNPARNVNYTSNDTRLVEHLKSRVAQRPPQPFFLSPPGAKDDKVLLGFQEAFVRKVLDVSLPFPNVLYCIDNETRAPAAWALHWGQFIAHEARKRGARIHTTEMWDAWDLRDPSHAITYTHPEIFSFTDISQNHWLLGKTHSDRLAWFRHNLLQHGCLRPMNNVKIYGCGRPPRPANPALNVDRFWKCIFAGCASMRFHRPLIGLGLNEVAQQTIRTAREFTSTFDIFRTEPRNDLFLHRGAEGSFCLATPGEMYAVYFPDGGEVKLDISLLKRPGTIRWLEISSSKWGKQQVLKAGQSVTLRPPGSGPWVVLLVRQGAAAAPVTANRDRIQPCHKNPRYWKYKGKPLLLLGGTDDDNLFQWTGSRLTEQLDLLKSVGGNYVRCTMSSRDEGNVWPFKKVSGKYNLDQWDNEYWRRLENFLKVTHERDIIVQVEIWATYDFYREFWPRHPFNPKNNINYTVEQTGLSEVVDHRPGHSENVFFQSVPAVRNQKTVLKYQRRFVDKMLSYSLKFGHVLYCMDNETAATPQWGKYWSEYVKTKAKEAGVDIQTTEMWYDHLDKNPPIPHATFDHPETYSFVDVSQNSHKRGQRHWDSVRLQLSRVADNVRPLTNVKIYGADTGPQRWFRADVDGVERFWRNIFGGMSSARFHRPPAGLGLGKKAQANIHSLRLLTDDMDIFTCSARSDLLSDRKPNEAYCLANPGKKYAVYFPDGGEVKLDISDVKGELKVRWLNIAHSRWSKEETLKGGGMVALTPPGTRQWAVLLTKNSVLPYGKHKGVMRVIHDNDQTEDVYTDEVLMAMASAGRIQLVGMITTRTVNGIGYDKYDKLVTQRKQMVSLARRSGMTHLPDPVKGPKVSLRQPPSGKIEDTRTIGSDGSRLIVREAHKADPGNPLVVICGGQLTAVADAWLLDPSIENKVVVAALLGSKKDMKGFNGMQDPWADYIVLQRLRYVQFPQSQVIPKVPKDWLRKNLPDTPLRRWMIAKIHPLFPDELPSDEDNDGQPVLPLLTDEYVIEVKRVAFGGWENKRFGKGSVRIPTFVSAERNGNSRAVVVVKANGKAGTRAWQAAMADPAAWKGIKGKVSK